MARPTKARAKERLQRALDAIPDLKQLRSDSADFEKWRRDTKVAIANTFEESPSKSKDFDDIRYFPFALVAGATSDSAFQIRYVRGLESAAAVLKSMIEEVEEYWEDDNRGPDPSGAPELLERINTKQVCLSSFTVEITERETQSQGFLRAWDSKQ